ncbi:hypothetical protein LLEC1_03590 [Akanthomyces lecanii]|uniref:AMP-dependent synthetase/ligase domain-containing protein n=1 Tax=Cordyceps confragosa TaxID=2714763 RepID=A0A179I9C9_CORDF|nr:hypothetical protein LLEC1_03590 [Akanthomyces lecanii]
MSTPTFPQDPILERLVAAVQRVADPAPLIHDVMGYTKGHPHLLGDILATRKRLLEQLPETVLQKNKLLKDGFVYVFLLCQSGYEYLVGFFAIRAIGGAVMPLAPGILPEEARYFQKQTSAPIILFGESCQEKVDEICADSAGAETATPFASCLVSIDAEPQPVTGISIDRQRATVEEILQAFVSHRITHALFGPILLSRLRDLIVGPAGVLSDAARDKYGSMFRGLACIRSGGSPIEPAVRQFWLDLTGLPVENFYASTEAGIRACSSLAGEDVRDQHYLVALLVDFSLTCLQGCIGLPVEGVEVKLSADPVGEMRLRSASMFTQCVVNFLLGASLFLYRNLTPDHSYIGDEEATRAAFDEDGFLKTSDLATFRNGQYYLLGRENLDCKASLSPSNVYCYHLSFPTSAVERALLAIPEVLEACVIGVSVRARAQLCGAVIRLRTAAHGQAGLQEVAARQPNASLRDIRNALRDSGRIPIHMHPVLLRVLEDEEVMPLTHSGKVAKGTALKQFFGGKDVSSTACLPEKVEVWHGLPSSDEMGTIKGDEAAKAWDWGGLQSA